jgi:aryl-alcohol dehydrogenase-like predicted oxidoreductase
VEYRKLGGSGLLVSELCLGCMTFGWQLDEPGSQRIVDRFIEAGGNFIDVANVYQNGVSEEITGRAIKAVRDQVVLATKVRFRMGDGPNDVGLSRSHIIAACEASLRRLGTDFIDLYQVHCWDDLTPLEETLSTLSDLVRQGKVRYVGASNFAGWHIIKAARVSNDYGFEHFVSLQPQYSLVERHIEYEVVPACLSEGLGIIPWGPLGQGFLTGKYRKGEPPPDQTRIADAEEEWEEHWSKRNIEHNWRIVNTLGEIADETGKSYAQVALNWLLCRPGVTSPIVGATRLEQLDDNLGATGWKLDDDQVRRLNEVSARPEPYPYNFIARELRT